MTAHVDELPVPVAVQQVRHQLPHGFLGADHHGLYARQDYAGGDKGYTRELAFESLRKGDF